MATYQMLFGIGKKGFVDPALSGGKDHPIALELDAILNETIKMESTLTKSPIETGEDVTDHVILTPDKLTIDAIVTNTPLGYVAIGTPFANPAKRALDFLTSVFVNRKPFDFVGGFKVYQNLVMTSFTPDRNSQTGDALRFNATLEKILIVSSAFVPVENLDASVEATGSTNKDLGSQQALAASAKTNSNETTIFSLVKHFGLVK